MTTLDHDPDPETLPGSKKVHGNGNGDNSIISLINHYSSFNETIKANSATGVIHQSITHPLMQDSNSLIPTFTIPRNHLHGIQDIPSEKLVIAAMPAYNEEKYIGKTIVQAKKYVDRVIVVDDGSNDATSEIAEQLGAYVIKHTVNKGYGGALQTIFKVARELHAEALIIIDSDGQHDPQFIPELLKPIHEGIDVVIGSRFISNDKSEIPGYRIVGMKVLDKATNFAGNIEVSDSQSGYRAYGRRAIEKIKVSGNGMSAGSEILLQITDNNLSVAEVPIKVRYDLGDTSTQNPISHGLMVLYSIIGIVGYRRPLVSFGFPGLVIFIFGLVFGSWAFAEYYATSKFPFTVSMISAVSLVLGLLLMTTALILNSLIQVVKISNTRE